MSLLHFVKREEGLKSVGDFNLCWHWFYYREFKRIKKAEYFLFKLLEKVKKDFEGFKLQYVSKECE